MATQAIVPLIHYAYLSLTTFLGAHSAARLKTLVERARDEQQRPQNRDALVLRARFWGCASLVIILCVKL